MPEFCSSNFTEITILPPSTKSVIFRPFKILPALSPEIIKIFLSSLLIEIGISLIKPVPLNTICFFNSLVEIFASLIAISLPK